ncbi:MAG: T9SS type A sorting domain-containing protein [Bacteroidetes bacterium]|nr:T9SS type A sorting domain-containing protein [Bacteroidota bacterium]
MKASILLFVISVLFFSNIVAQSTIELSEDVSFYSSYPDISIDKTADTITYLHDGSLINYKNYRINNAVPFLDQTFIRRNEESEITVYKVEGKAKEDNWLADPTKDTDTLFIVLDTVYGGGMLHRVFIDREINYTGIAVPTWINNTFGYLANLEHGILNIAAVLPSDIGPYMYLVFRENYEFTGQDTIFLSASEAIHEINFDPVDENGNFLGNQAGTFSALFTLVFDLANGGIVPSSWGWLGNSNYYISDYYGETIDLFFGSSITSPYSGDPTYIIEYPLLDSITQDVTLTNNPDDLANAVLNYTYYDKRDYNKIGIGIMLKLVAFTGNYGIWGMTSFMQQAANPNWECDLYMDMQDSEKFGYCLRHKMDYIEDGESYNYIQSYYDEYNDSIAGFLAFLPEADEYYVNAYDTLFFGNGTSYYWSNWSNFSNRISCVSDNMGMWGNYFTPFTNTNTYVIKDANGNTIQEGTGLEILVDGLEPDKYTVELLNSSCHFNGYTGSSTLFASFDKSKADPNPPPLKEIQLLNAENTMKYHFEAGEEVLLKFSASDFIGYDPYHVGIGFQPVVDSLTVVSIKEHSETDWSDVYCQIVYSDSIIGYQYQSTLTDYMLNDSAMYDVRILVEDYSGNTSEYSFYPAFIYGDFIVGVPEGTSNSINRSNINIAPNPVHENLYLSNIVASDNSLNYEILNPNGQVVKYGAIAPNGSQAVIRVSDLSAGLYIISLLNNNTPISSAKFIKAQ